MWLGTKKQRLAVNIAGIYINTVISGLLMFLAYAIPNPTVALFMGSCFGPKFSATSDAERKKHKNTRIFPPFFHHFP